MRRLDCSCEPSLPANNKKLRNLPPHDVLCLVQSGFDGFISQRFSTPNSVYYNMGHTPKRMGGGCFAVGKSAITALSD